MWSGLRIEAASTSESISWIAKISASSRMTIIPSWLMSSSRPTNGRDERRAGLGRQQALVRGEDQRAVGLDAFLGEAADRLEAVLGHRDLDHDVRGERREVAALLEHPVDVVRDDLGRDRARGDLADLLEDLVVRAADLGVEGRIRGHAIEDAPSSDGLDLFDVGGVQEDLHRWCSKAGRLLRGDSSPPLPARIQGRRPSRDGLVTVARFGDRSGAGDGLDRVRGRRGSVLTVDRARREDRLAPVADGKRRGDEAVEQRVRPLGS